MNSFTTTAATEFEYSKSQKVLPVWLDYLCLAVISLICTQILVGHWSTRLSQAPLDETCVAHSYFFANKDLFCFDLYMQTWAPKALSSIINWLPGLLHKYIGVQPFYLFVALTCLQNMLLPMALYWFSVVATGRRFVGWFAAGLTLLWLPHHWNISLVGGLLYIPYANWVALPFLLCALTTTMLGQWKKSALLLSLASAIHPIMGSVCAGICCIYHLLCIKEFSARDTMIKLAITVLSAVLPPAICITVSTYGIAYVPDSARLTEVLTNPHVIPWSAEFPFGVSSFAAGTLMVVSSVIFGWSARFLVAANARKLFIAAASLTVLTMIIHFVAACLKIAAILNLISTRSSILFTLVALPYGLSAAMDLLQRKKPGIFLPFLSVFSAASSVSFFSLALANAGLVLMGRSTAAIKSIGLVLQVIATLLACLVFFVKPYLNTWTASAFSPKVAQVAPFLTADGQQHAFWWHIQSIIIAGLCLIAARVIARFLRPGKFTSIASSAVLFQTLLIGLIFIWCVQNSIFQAKSEITLEVADYARIQKWARENTDKNAAFALVAGNAQNSWRGLAKRQVVVTAPIGEVYRTTSLGREYNKKLIGFFKKFGISASDLENKKEVLQKLEANDWLDFGAQFNADYLVVSNKWPRMELPIAHKSLQYSIYKVPNTRSTKQ